MSNLNIKKASTIISNGGVIAYPTEAVFGLGCDPMNQQAVEKLLRIKDRSEKKGLILVAAELQQLAPFIHIDELPAQLFNKIMQSWPGPVNWLLPAAPLSPEYLRGIHKLQAVRISEHPTVRALCLQFGGAIVSTSANISKRPPTKTAIQTRLRFNNKIDYILNGNIGLLKQPCEIRNGLNNNIIRPAN